jgi:hypothetical protein
MFFIKLAELTAIIVIGLFIISEVIIPSLNKRPMFPTFRREKKLKAQLDLAHQMKYEDKLEKQIEETLEND